MRPLFVLLISLLSGSLLGGCVQLSKPYQTTSFYTLEYEAPVASDQEKLPVSIHVGRFEIAPEYDSSRMVYRDQALSRNSFLHHRWRVHPADLVRSFLARDLRAAETFQMVVTEFTGRDADSLLDGVIEEFLFARRGDGWEAVLRVNIVLRKAMNSADPNGLLFQQSFAVSAPSRDKSPQGFAQAMSLAMREVSILVRDEVSKMVQSHHDE